MHSVSDVVSKEVVTFRPETTLAEAIAVLCQLQISGAPVVADDSRLVGVISEFALMDVLFDPSLKEAPVADYMTKEVHWLTEHDSLTHAVHMFALYGVRRLPVVRDSKLVGIVSRRDLLKVSENLDEPLATPLDELMPELAASFHQSGREDGVAELVDHA